MKSSASRKPISIQHKPFAAICGLNSDLRLPRMFRSDIWFVFGVSNIRALVFDSHAVVRARQTDANERFALEIVNLVVSICISKTNLLLHMNQDVQM